MGWRKVFRTRGDMGATAVSHAQRTADFVQRTAYFYAGNFQERENLENLLRDDRENLLRENPDFFSRENLET